MFCKCHHLCQVTFEDFFIKLQKRLPDISCLPSSA